MNIFLVEEHEHYESSTILSAHLNKENAVQAALKIGDKYKFKTVMSKDGTVCKSSCTSINVIEIELDDREFYEIG